MTSSTLSTRNFILCCSLITLSLGSILQQFESTPSDVTTDPDTSAKLTCKVRNRKGECNWLSATRANQSLSVVAPISGKYEYARNPSNGDCSIQIFNASLSRDDGQWECQVSAASQHEDNLQSQIVKLTVKHPPVPPTIEHHSQEVGNVVFRNGEEFVAEADVQTTFVCVSRKGNPPAKLLWFIDEKIEVTNLAVQTNESDSDLSKTFRAKSSLRHTFNRGDDGKTLKCVAVHDAYNTGSQEVKVHLNISYKPNVKLELSPPAGQDVEEGESLTMTCTAMANPPATIIWDKSGQQNFHFSPTISFSQLKRADSGVYSCGAKNKVGDSDKQTVTLDVKYKPKVVKVEPRSHTAEIYHPLRLTCEGEGNPPPTFQWLQSVNGKANTWQQRSVNATFYVPNVTFEYQGKYVCEVSNNIKGKQNKHQSAEVDLDIVGPPQPISEPSGIREAIVVEKDDNAIINVAFCSDPEPLKMYWEWGSVKLDLGLSLARYVSKHLTSQDLPQDCFVAKLVIANVVTSDSRKYTFHAQNDKGATTFEVTLKVKEPVTVSAVVGIVVGCLVIAVMIIILVFYMVRREKCFVLRKRGFNPDGSENSSRRLSEDMHHHNNGSGGGVSPTGKDRAIPPDALYTDVQPTYDRLNAPEPSLAIATTTTNGDSVVYADLDLKALDKRKVGGNSRAANDDRIEYAEIQFKPNTAIHL